MCRGMKGIRKELCRKSIKLKTIHHSISVYKLNSGRNFITYKHKINYVQMDTYWKSNKHENKSNDPDTLLFHNI